MALLRSRRQQLRCRASTPRFELELALPSFVRLVATPPSVAPHSHAWFSPLKGEQLRTFLLLQPDPDNLKREIEAFRVAAAGTGGTLRCVCVLGWLTQRPGCPCLANRLLQDVCLTRWAALRATCTGMQRLHLSSYVTHVACRSSPADAPRFEVHRLLMADSGTLLLCSVDHTGHLAQVR